MDTTPDQRTTLAGKQPANLTAQLATSAPEIKTYQALLIFGMQQDFLASNAALTIDTSSGFVQRILDLVPKFRDRAGHIVWVRSDLACESAADAITGAGKTVKKFFVSLDHELDKTSGLDSSPVTASTSNVSDFADEVKPAVSLQADHLIEKRYCSAFTSPQFQMTLHQNLIGDVYVCGATSEVSIYAFARDAASRGLRVHIIEDCLGYRNRSRNEFAIRRMVAHMNVNKMTSASIHQELDEPLEHSASANDLADMLTDAMTVDSPQRPVATPSTPSRRGMMLRHSRSEHLLLPSGELKKKSSRTKIYSRKLARAKATMANQAEPPNENQPSPT